MNPTVKVFLTDQVIDLRTMYKKSDGFTLIELIVVITILGIIVAIVVPRLTGFKSMAEESVCDTNRRIIERTYFVYLDENSIDHADSIFNQLLAENFDVMCPIGGVISYADGGVRCSLHKDIREDDENDPSVEEVPWL